MLVYQAHYPFYLTPTTIGGEVDSEGDAASSINVEGLELIGERVETNGKKQSYLTGEWKDAAVVDRRPMGVMIPNNESALPQHGISYASVIYEAPMEFLSCTRLMGVFEDYDSLDYIGSLRSARSYFCYFDMSLDAIYCNWGLAIPFVGPIINTDRIDNISAGVLGIDNPSDEAFDRDKAREEAGYATEYTGIMTISGYEQAVERQGYETNYRSTFQPTFTFAADGYRVTYDEFESATKVSPGGYTRGAAGGGYEHATPYFQYNASDGLYHRYQFGAPQIDEMNNEELTCSNVVFMVMPGFYCDENTGYLEFDMYGYGVAYVCTNGKCVKGAWHRADGDNTPYKYYDSWGNEIIFNQGKTWVCLIWDEYEQYVTIE